MTRSHYGMGLPVMEYLSMPSGPETDTSWTDDLTLCTQTGVGFSQNQSYKRDGHWNPDHESEDESFHFLDDTLSIWLYGVFDGHCGTRASKFAKERLPAEILLGQLADISSEETVREILRQAFLTVEKEYFSDYIGTQLAQRITLLSDMPTSQSRNLYHCPPGLAQLNQEVASGTTAVVVLIYRGKLYVSNVGNSRALLCRTDPEGVLRVGQLNVGHDLRNDDELCRLQQLGLDVQKLVAASRLGNQINTRCLGNYLVKGGYKEFDQLQNAGGEPVIATPEIHPGVTLDDSCRFLILFTDGLYKALSEATESEQVNIHLAQMIVEEFKTQSSLNLVAQAVVDKVSRMHHDFYMKSTYPNKANKREDMTLLIRNFNFPVPNSTMSPPGSRSVGRYTQQGIYRAGNYGYDSNNATPVNASVGDGPSGHHLISSTNRSAATNSTSNTEPTTSTDSDLLTHSEFRLTLDENGRVLPYVDFSDYYKNLGSKSGWSDDNIF